MPIPISIQLWSLREQMTGGQHPAILRRLSELGYRGVECGDLFGMQPRAFRALVEDLGMSISGYHQQLPTPEQAPELAERALALGLSQVVFAWTDPKRWQKVDDLARLGDEIEHARVALAREGVALIYHNHDHEVHPLAGRLGLAHLLERVPELLMEIDTYWAADFGAQDAAAIVREFAARCPLLHIKDGAFVKGQPQLAVGSGRMDIPAVIAAADPAVTKWLVVELDECGTDMWTAVAESYRYLIANGLAAGTHPARAAATSQRSRA